MEALVPIFAAMVTFAPIILAIIFWHRAKVMKHQQIMTMIDKGLLRGDIDHFYGKSDNPRQRKGYLKVCGLFIGVGLGIFFAQTITSLLHVNEDAAVAYYFAFILILGSVGYILGNLVKDQYSEEIKSDARELFGRPIFEDQEYDDVGYDSRDEKIID